MKQNICLAGIFSGLIVISFAIAHTGAIGVVKERMMAMKSIAEAVKTIDNLEWSNIAVARAVIIERAAELQKHAADIVRLFPEGSDDKPSEATPAIWLEADEFSKIAWELENSALQLGSIAPTANSRDDIQPQFVEIANTCKTCHQNFRKKK